MQVLVYRGLGKVERGRFSSVCLPAEARTGMASYAPPVARIIWDARLVRVDGSQPDYSKREGAPNPNPPKPSTIWAAP